MMNKDNVIDISKRLKRNAERLTSGFTQAGVYARRQFCADIQVCSPQEVLWNPRLREAATTLAAISATAWLFAGEKRNFGAT